MRGLVLSKVCWPAPKKEKPKVHVDLQHKIEQLTMQELPQTCWPKSSVVDALASAIDKVKKDTEVEKPFVYQDLDKYLPSWCFSPFEAELQQEPDKKKKEMDMLSWSLAYDRFGHECLFCLNLFRIVHITWTGMPWPLPVPDSLPLVLR